MTLAVAVFSSVFSTLYIGRTTLSPSGNVTSVFSSKHSSVNASKAALAAAVAQVPVVNPLLRA